MKLELPSGVEEESKYNYKKKQCLMEENRTTSLLTKKGKHPLYGIGGGPCVVTQVRTKAVDGYDALQLGFDDKAEKGPPMPPKGISKKQIRHQEMLNSGILKKN